MPVPDDWSAKLKAWLAEWRALSDDDRFYRDLKDDPFKHFVYEEHATSWEGFQRWCAEVSSSAWCFRGQGNAKWSLSTYLDRERQVHYSGKGASSNYRLDGEPELRRLLEWFQHELPRDHAPRPDEGDVASWLALMQHHGAPTKLLDWTRRADVALFFAVEKMPRHRPAVWALDWTWFEARARVTLGLPTTAQLSTLLAEPADVLKNLQKAVIIKVEPATPTPRMRAQDGILLSKLYDQPLFYQVLASMMCKLDVVLDRPVIRKLTMKPGASLDILQRLHRDDVHAASLFPDADGIGREALNSMRRLVEEARQREVTSNRDYLAEQRRERAQERRRPQ